MQDTIMRLLAPRFVVTFIVIVAAFVLRLVDAVGATEWVTVTLGAGGVYSLSAPAAQALKNYIRETRL